MPMLVCLSCTVLYYGRRFNVSLYDGGMFFLCVVVCRCSLFFFVTVDYCIHRSVFFSINFCTYKKEGKEMRRKKVFVQ